MFDWKVVGIFHLFLLTTTVVNGWESPWTWQCDEPHGRCLKELHQEGDPRVSLSACKLTCDTLLWPLPSSMELHKTTSIFHPDNINLQVEGEGEAEELVMGTLEWQKSLLNSSWPRKDRDGAGGEVNLKVVIKHPTTQLSPALPENYTLVVKKVTENLEIEIVAENFFGARHGLETLFQLIEFDEFDKNFIILDNVTIQDTPAFPHRGIMIDTARNFITKNKILQIIDSMSFSKLNVLHWHIADTQSFPLHLDSLPGLASYGAYGEDMVYSTQDVHEIMDHAKHRGVMILPEFDAPAHVGAGWQSQNPTFTVCVDWEPWYEMCVQPGCGQLNPTVDGMYEVLEKIHTEYLHLFTPSVLHMGGDEINFNCWNSSESIVNWLQLHGKGRQEEDFMYLWNYYQNKSYSLVQSASTSQNLPTPEIILWTNHFTSPDYIHYLDPKTYAIQIWTDATDENIPTIKLLAEGGFKTIFSNTDSQYLDCGFSAWIGEGNNWCSPYKGWQKIYQNDLYEILRKKNVNNLEVAMANVLGGEVALWSEQTDDMSVLAKLEPRMSAHGERMWSNPDTGFYEAERRMVHHRERLRRRGIEADVLQPRWCHQNEKQCYTEEWAPQQPTPGPTTPKSASSRSAAAQVLTVISSLSLAFLLFNKDI